MTPIETGGLVLVAYRVCTYGCADEEELRRWIDAGHDPQH